MTSVNGVAAATTAQGPSTANVVTADYEAFLRLLVAELENQDPTEPMDSTQYITQLATFSNVEQGIQTNEKLDMLLRSGYLSEAGSLIGRTLTTPDNAISGTIEQVRVFDDGVVAVLGSGVEVAVTGGVTIS
ncbi:flagellar hook assembly protein FlgD [Oricola sp.]|uniref:flagellar hook assembly protein FlgD n=1 Tax=Oricola sp. TaxID=1979950 RepID=UPI003BAC91B0